MNAEEQYIHDERLAICLESDITTERAEQIAADEARRRDGEAE